MKSRFSPISPNPQATSVLPLLSFHSLANGPSLAPLVAERDVTYRLETDDQLCSRISERCDQHVHQHPGCAARAAGHANRIQSWRISVRRAARAVGERSASSGHRDPWRLLARALRLDGSRASVRSGNPAGTGDVEPGIPTHWKSRWRMAGDARRCANGRGAFGKDRGGAITRSETRGGDGALRGRTPRALAGETERDCAEGPS